MEKREEIIEEMKRKVKEAFISRDKILIYGEGMAKDLGKTTNILFERLEEWYKIYFPELKLEDKKKYCQLILALDKEKMEESKKAIVDLLGEEGNKFADLFQRTSGIDLMAKDLEKLRRVAQEIILLIKLKEEIGSYTEAVAREVCPNASTVGGPAVASKLVARVGGLERVARLPASTIQVLGAEKALFKHMRKKTKPPKHGIIFQHAAIHSSPREIRGKIARALATKLSIAFKADAYSKKFIGEELKKKFDERVNKIKSGKVG